MGEDMLLPVKRADSGDEHLCEDGTPHIQQEVSLLVITQLPEVVMLDITSHLLPKFTACRQKTHMWHPGRAHVARNTAQRHIALPHRGILAQHHLLKLHMVSLVL